MTFIIDQRLHHLSSRRRLHTNFIFDYIQILSATRSKSWCDGSEILYHFSGGGLLSIRCNEKFSKINWVGKWLEKVLQKHERTQQKDRTKWIGRQPDYLHENHQQQFESVHGRGFGSPYGKVERCSGVGEERRGHFQQQKVETSDISEQLQREHDIETTSVQCWWCDVGICCE